MQMCMDDLTDVHATMTCRNKHSLAQLADHGQGHEWTWCSMLVMQPDGGSPQCHSSAPCVYLELSRSTERLAVLCSMAVKVDVSGSIFMALVGRIFCIWLVQGVLRALLPMVGHMTRTLLLQPCLAQACVCRDPDLGMGTGSELGRVC